MKQLMQSRLIRLLTEPSLDETYSNNLKNAYGEFAQCLLDKLQSETNLMRLYYNLGFVKMELVGIDLDISNEKKKKHPYSYRKNDSYH